MKHVDSKAANMTDQRGYEPIDSFISRGSGAARLFRVLCFTQVSANAEQTLPRMYLELLLR